MIATLPPLARVDWPQAYRVIRSIHPPIDLFEDIADPRDWEALASAEAKTNPRLWDHIGKLDQVPVDRRVHGPGASYAMAPFVHNSRDRPGRFTDGSYGVYSAGDAEEVAIREVAHHHGIAMAASAEAAGWTSQFRVLISRFALELNDVRGIARYHHETDYAPTQQLGARLRQAGSNGVLYDSVRSPGGLCAALFWPDLVGTPMQGDHYDYHWDGARVDKVRNCRSLAIFGL